MNSLSAMHDVWAAIAASPGCCRLLAVSVEVAVLAVAVWCLIRVLRIRSARVCSLLWILVLAKGLFGLAFGAPLEVAGLRLTEPARPSQSATTAMSAEDLARQEADLQRALREAESSAGASAASAPNGTDGTRPSSPAVGAQLPQRTKPTLLSGVLASLSRFSFAAHAAGVLTAVWLVGVLWALLATALDLRRIRGLARASGAPSERLLAAFRAEAARLGIARVPALSVCAEVESPALAGFLRPTVLAPAWLAETADADQLRWMLAHELMHYKQKDTVGLLVRRAAQVALWFHPAVWWAGRQWEEAMERACDRALIAGEADARHYAEQLHGVLKSLMARRSRVRVVTGLFATRTQIGKRIAALLTDSLAMPARLSPSSATLVALFAAGALSFGVGVHRPAAAQGPGAAETPLPKPTPTVQERVTLVQVDLRSIATAMESYRVDYDTYPATLLPVLTTPLAYMAHIPEDPFSRQTPPDIYHLNVRTPDKHPVLYSVGPDGVDQEGLVAYDPAQGEKSAGDIVKRLDGTYAAAAGTAVGIEAPRAAQPPAAPVVREGAAKTPVVSSTSAKTTATFSLQLRWVATESQRGEAEPLPWHEMVASQHKEPAPWVLGEVLLGEKDLGPFELTDESSGRYNISARLSDSARAQFAQITEGNLRRQIAVVLDGKVLSTPTILAKVNDAKIRLGVSLPLDEAQSLVRALGGTTPVTVAAHQVTVRLEFDSSIPEATRKQYSQVSLTKLKSEAPMQAMDPDGSAHSAGSPIGDGHLVFRAPLKGEYGVTLLGENSQRPVSVFSLPKTLQLDNLAEDQSLDKVVVPPLGKVSVALKFTNSSGPKPGPFYGELYAAGDHFGDRNAFVDPGKASQDLIDPVVAGEYDASFGIPGFMITPVPQHVTVLAGKTTAIRLDIKPDGQVSGFVYRKGDGTTPQPVTPREIVLKGPSGVRKLTPSPEFPPYGLAFRGQHDEAYKYMFSFVNLKAGTYELTIQADGYQDYHGTYQVVPGVPMPQQQGQIFLEPSDGAKPAGAVDQATTKTPAK